MNRFGRWIVVVVIFLSGNAVISCSNVFNADEYKIKSIEASPSEALPLAFGDLSISDILSSQDSQYIKVDNDGLVYLDYDQTLRSQSIRDLITINDKTDVQGVLPVPAGTLPPVNNDTDSNVITTNTSLNFTNGEQLSEILLKAGQLTYTIDNIQPAAPNFKFAVRISVSEFKDASGNVLAIETTGNSGSAALSNYKYVSATPNKLTVVYTLILKKNSNSVLIKPNTSVKVHASFIGLDYKYAKGFFGDQTADLDAQTINIKAFGSSLLDGANVSFANPSIELIVTNEVGVPTIVTFATLEARKPGSSLPLNITPVIAPNTVAIAVPVTMGASATTDVSVTNANALLDFSPTQFFYKASARINKGVTPPPAIPNFITDTSKLNVRLHVQVPLYGHASNIILRDTIAIDLSDADRSEITDAALKIKTTNQIPLSANLQLYLADENFVVLDSLLAPDQVNLIKSSTVNSNGEFVSAGVDDEFIPLSKDVLEKLFKAKNLLIKARINTTQNGNVFPDVKFKSDYKMNVKLGLKVNARIKVNI